MNAQTSNKSRPTYHQRSCWELPVDLQEVSVVALEPKVQHVRLALERCREVSDLALLVVRDHSAREVYGKVVLKAVHNTVSVRARNVSTAKRGQRYLPYQ